MRGREFQRYSLTLGKPLHKPISEAPLLRDFGRPLVTPVIQQRPQQHGTERQPHIRRQSIEGLELKIRKWRDEIEIPFSRLHKSLTPSPSRSSARDEYDQS